MHERSMIMHFTAFDIRAVYLSTMRSNHLIGTIGMPVISLLTWLCFFHVKYDDPPIEFIDDVSIFNKNSPSSPDHSLPSFLPFFLQQCDYEQALQSHPMAVDSPSPPLSPSVETTIPIKLPPPATDRPTLLPTQVLPPPNETPPLTVA